MADVGVTSRVEKPGLLPQILKHCSYKYSENNNVNADILCHELRFKYICRRTCRRLFRLDPGSLHGRQHLRITEVDDETPESDKNSSSRMSSTNMGLPHRSNQSKYTIQSTTNQSRF
jgi:hypothetical protein